MNFILEKLIKKAAKDPSKLVAKAPDEDFIPYVCHYDEHTILTKNGELMQTIRIAGFNSSSAISELISLRETVRDSVVDNIKENKFALGLTRFVAKKTLRQKASSKIFSPKKLTTLGSKKIAGTSSL